MSKQLPDEVNKRIDEERNREYPYHLDKDNLGAHYKMGMISEATRSLGLIDALEEIKKYISEWTGIKAYENIFNRAEQALNEYNGK